jgi:hypothetical protein
MMGFPLSILSNTHNDEMKIRGNTTHANWETIPFYSSKKTSGWEISGRPDEDWLDRLYVITAYHPIYRYLYIDFRHGYNEDFVLADAGKDGTNDFLKHHPPGFYMFD